MKKQFTPLALLVATLFASTGVTAQVNSYKQTFGIQSNNLASSNTGLVPYPFLPAPEAESGVTVGRENDGRVDLLAFGDAGYLRGLGSGSQLRLSSFSTGINKFGISSINSPGTNGHFYTAFTLKANLSPGGSIKFITGSGVKFSNGNQLPDAAVTASSIQFFRHATAGDLRLGFLNGNSATTVHGANIDWTQQNRIEVYANNTVTPTTYYRCGVAQNLPANTQHIYVNGTKVTGVSFPTGDFGLSNMTDGTSINAINFITNTPGSDAYIDDIHYSANLGNPVALSGTYEVNAAKSESGVFSDLDFATKAIGCHGIAGNVTFNVVGNIHEPLELGDLANGNHLVTINGTGATLDFCSGSASGNVDMVRINGTDNLVFNGFTLNANCTYGTGIKVINGANNVTLSNNIISLPPSTSVHNKGIYATAGSNLSVTGNTVNGGRRGIQVEGQTGTVAINNNSLTDAYEYGISLVGASAPAINGNNIAMRTGNGTSVAFNGNMLNGFSLNGNTFIGAGRAGIQLNNSNNGVGASQSVIANNRIGYFQSTDKAYGVYLYKVNTVNIYHNNIMVDAGSTMGDALRVGSAAAIDVRNNVFAYSGSGSGRAVYGAPNAYSNLSHNNYFHAAGGNILHLNQPVANLTALAALGYSVVGSSDADPQFNAQMLVQNPSLRDVATAPVLVQFDFEGDERLAGSVDLGADEFVPAPQGPSRLAGKAINAEVYPNPFLSELTVKLSSTEAGQVQVTVTDVMGRQVSNSQFSVEAGTNNLAIGLDQSLVQGVYLLSVRQGNATSLYRVVKQ